MGTPQNPRARHRQKARRAKKEATYAEKKAVEVAAAPKKASASTIAKSR